ncbi:MAG TPA: hypothetical protein VM422_03740, partial [Amaricoccus sp.]|nr:hypothetical protein [Amaricoccus sp.]
MTKSASKFGTSQSVARKEDVRFLTGAGRYIDDVAPEGALHALFFRSPVAHGRVRSLDVSAAAAAPGVAAVFTAADFAGKLENSIDSSVVRNRDGSRGAKPRRPVLADDVVRFAGEALAVVLAETREAGLDAVELIEADFDELPVHVATAVGGPTIHPEAPENLAFDWAHGDEAAADRAFAEAAHRSRDVHWQLVEVGLDQLDRVEPGLAGLG